MKIVTGVFLLLWSTCAYAQCPDGPAKKYQQLSSDLEFGQAYAQAAMYELYVCICKNGLSTDAAALERNKALAAKAKKEALRFKNDLDLRSMTGCSYASSSGGSAEGSAAVVEDDTPLLLKGAIINDALMGYLNDIAANSGSYKIKSMVSQMNKVSHDVSKTRNQLNTFGLNTPEHDDFLNFVENAGHAIAIGKALFHKPTLEETLSPSQLEARQLASNLLRQLEEIHKTASKLQHIQSTDADIHDLILKERLEFDQYEFHTAPSRLLAIKWLTSSDYLTLEQYYAYADEIDNMSLAEILDEIEGWKDSRFLKNYGYLLPKEDAFKSEVNRMNLALIQHYRESGDESKAAEVMRQIDFDVPAAGTPALIYESYVNHNYQATSQYYDVLKSFLLKADYHYLHIVEGLKDYEPTSIYNELDGIYRDRLLFILNLGVLSMIKSGDIDRVPEEILFLKKYNDQLVKFKDKKKYRNVYKKMHSANQNSDVEAEHEIGSALIDLVEALYQSKIDPTYDCKALLEESKAAFMKYDWDHHLDEGFIEVQQALVLFNALIHQGKWEEAIAQSNDILRQASKDYDGYDSPILSKVDIKINQAFIYFKMNEIQKAGNILKLLSFSGIENEGINVLTAMIAENKTMNDQ